MLFYHNRLKMNELVAKVDVNEELKFDHNSLISVHKSYQLDADFKRKNDFNVFASDMKLFNFNIKDLSDGNDLFYIKGFLPDRVFD